MLKWLLLLMATIRVDVLHAIENDLTGFKEAQAAQAAGEYDKAYSLYLRISQNENNALAQFHLGLFHRLGWGRPVQPAQACRWFEKAAIGGIPYAQHLYGECLEFGQHLPPDPSAAAFWYEQAAKSGHVVSNCYLAQMYVDGRGVERDPRHALELCHSAALSSPEAMLLLGRLYWQGDASIRDTPLAYYWLQQAAQFNLPKAYYYLGMMIEQGLFSTLSTQQALENYEQAASRGYVEAYFPTARLYFEAPNDPQTQHLRANDLAKAYLWLSATQKRSQDEEELAQSRVMLRKILIQMPSTWRHELDSKLEQYLAQYP